MDISIREFRETDAEAISEVGRASWLRTYTHIYGTQYIEKRMAVNYHPDNIRRSAAATEHTQMYVAEVDGKVVGFAQPCYYNYWDPETFDPAVMLLSRIYIDPQYFRLGIGTRLLTKSEQWMASKGFDSYVLKVHQDNPIGRQFYEKMGFEQVEPADEEGEILLRKTITLV